jgi:nitrite reductase/ring-hydroxylating ferredoxin subunit
VRRAKGLVDISRRDFCAFACLGIALPACLDGDHGAIQTGGLTGSDGTLLPDASVPGDGMQGGGDGGVAASCSGSFFDVGAASSFVLNQPKQFNSPNYIFVVRDAAGLYAMTTKCPHKQVILNNYSGSTFFCPAHGAQFHLDGSVLPFGPTSKSLTHYAMCTISGGHVGVETSMIVSATQRLVA